MIRFEKQEQKEFIEQALVELMVPVKHARMAADVYEAVQKAVIEPAEQNAESR